jgi:protein gp37
MNDTRFHWVEDFAEPQETKGFMKAIHRREPTTFFVGDLCDLFGEWVSDDLIERVFDECAAYWHHTYIFLTKNPKRYVALDKAGKLPNRKNFWYGTTVTTQNQWMFVSKVYKTFLSIEPIMGDFPIDFIAQLRVEMFSTKPKQRIVNGINAVILGAETGNRSDKVVPQKGWIDHIVQACGIYKVSVFMKDSLLPIVGAENMRRELPWEVTR